MIANFGDLCNICVNVPANKFGMVEDCELLKSCGEIMVALAKTTPNGEGNFNFTVNFSCPPGIPYFPAGYNTTAKGESFAIGLEVSERWQNGRCSIPFLFAFFFLFCSTS